MFPCDMHIDNGRNQSTQTRTRTPAVPEADAGAGRDDVAKPSLPSMVSSASVDDLMLWRWKPGAPGRRLEPAKIMCVSTPWSCMVAEAE
jgi:hypothetical protein